MFESKASISSLIDSIMKVENRELIFLKMSETSLFEELINKIFESKKIKLPIIFSICRIGDKGISIFLSQRNYLPFKLFLKGEKINKYVTKSSKWIEINMIKEICVLLLKNKNGRSHILKWIENERINLNKEKIIENINLLGIFLLLIEPFLKIENLKIPSFKEGIFLGNKSFINIANKAKYIAHQKFLKNILIKLQQLEEPLQKKKIIFKKEQPLLLPILRGCIEIFLNSVLTQYKEIEYFPSLMLDKFFWTRVLKLGNFLVLNLIKLLGIDTFEELLKLNYLPKPNKEWLNINEEIIIFLSMAFIFPFKHKLLTYKEIEFINKFLILICKSPKHLIDLILRVRILSSVSILSNHQDKIMNKNIIFTSMFLFVEAEYTGRASQYYDRSNIRQHIIPILTKFGSINKFLPMKIVSQNIELSIRFCRFILEDISFITEQVSYRWDNIEETRISHPIMTLEINNWLKEEEEKIDEMINEEIISLKFILELISNAPFYINHFLAEENIDSIVDCVLMTVQKVLESSLPKKNTLLSNLMELIGIFSLHEIFSNKAINSIHDPLPPISIEEISQAASLVDYNSIWDLIQKMSIPLNEEDIYLNEENFNEEPPEHFLCSLMCEIMKDPVKLPSGQVCERVVIERHIISDPTDPFTRNPCYPDSLIPLPELKLEIENWKKKHKI